MTSSARASRVLGVLATSLLLGALTSWAQGVLPAALAPFANSSSGWTVLSVLLVAAVRPSLPAGAVLGVLSFECLLVGYTLASELRGLAYSPVLWGAVGLVAGPFVGAAAAALVGRHAVRAALGAGAVAGVLVADAIYGLTVVAASTSPVYWSGCLVLATVLVVAAAVRVRAVLPVLVLVGTTVAACATVSAGYAVLNDLSGAGEVR